VLHNIPFGRPEYIQEDNSWFVLRKNMNVGLLLGTLVGVIAYLTTRKTSDKPFRTASTPTRLQHLYTLTDDKPDPIQLVESTVQGLPNEDFYTLHLYLKYNTNIIEVEFMFATTMYASVTALVTAMNTTFQAWPHDALLFPNWDKLKVSQAVDQSLYIWQDFVIGQPYSYKFAFGYTDDADTLLDLLGFDDIPVTKTASLITASALDAVRVPKLGLFKWAPHFDCAFGDRILLKASASCTLKITGGSFLVSVDGKSKACRKVTYVTGTHFVVRALSLARIIISIVYPRGLPTSGVSQFTEEHIYTSPGTLLLSETTTSVYIETVGCGGSSSSGSYGGAGACVSGYVQSIPDSLSITVGSSAGDLSRVTGTDLDVIAGGGGAGGTFAAGGSSKYHGMHGQHSLITSRLGKYAVLQNAGQGASNSAGGASAKGQAGSILVGGTLSGYPKGGNGHYGGGSGGKEVFQTKTYYGGAGGGSSYTRGLVHVTISEPSQITTTPKTTKKTITGTYGNGGNSTVAFGPGCVKIFVTHE
jgi:hypothetical protein